MFVWGDRAHGDYGFTTFPASARAILGGCLCEKRSMSNANALPFFAIGTPRPFRRLWAQLPVSLIVVSLLCIGALRAQAVIPHHHLLFQASAMAVGILWVATAPYSWDLLGLQRGWMPWKILGIVIFALMVLVLLGKMPSGFANLYAWGALPVLLVGTLGFLPKEASNGRWLLMGALWMSLGLGCLWGQLDLGILPLASLAVFLLLWRGRLLMASGLVSLLALAGLSISMARHGFSARMLGTYFTNDPLGRDFSASRVRHILNHMGWFGQPDDALSHIPTSPTHSALGLLSAHGGWLGLILWFGMAVFLLVAGFRIAYRNRGILVGDLLACLSFLLAALTLTSTAHALGIGGLGVTIPILGVDPGLTLVTLFTVGLGAHLGDTSSPQLGVKP